MSEQAWLAIGILGAVVILGAFALSIAWVYRDAGRRGKTALAWLLIAAFTWPFGVAVYAVLRRGPVQL